MAEFSVNLAGPQGAGASPVAPVSDRLDLSPVADIFDMFAKGLANKRKEDAEAAKNAVISEYSQKLGAIEEAQISGQWNASRVNLERRKLDRMFFANSPQYITELKSVREGFISGGGVGEALKAEENKIAEFNKLISDASTKSGIPVSLNDPRPVQEAAVNAHLEGVRFDESMRRKQAQLTFETGVSQEQRAKFRQDVELQTNEALSRLGTANRDVFLARAEDAVKIFRGGGDIAPAIESARQHLTMIKMQAEALSRLNPGMASAFVKAYEDDFQFLVDLPKMDSAQADDMFKQMVNKRALMMVTKREDALNLAASAKAFPTVQMGSRELNLVSDMLKFTDKPAPSPDLVSSVEKQHMGHDIYKKWRAQADKEGSVEGGKQVDNLGVSITKSMGMAGRVEGMSTETFSGFVDWVASPEFKNLRQAGKLDQQTLIDAKDAHTQFYFKPMGLALQNKMAESFELTPISLPGVPRSKDNRPPNPMVTQDRVQPRSASFADLVDFKIVGDVVIAEPKLVDGRPLDTRDSIRLSNEIKGSVKHLNTFLKAGANLDGYDSVKEYWEDQKHVIFPAIYPNPAQVKAGGVYEMDGKKYRYTGGIPWRKPEYWEEVKGE